MLRLTLAGWLLGAILAPLAAAAEPFPKFEAQEIDPRAGNICYAVAGADVDGDGKPDLVVVTENRVVWYQNPTWTLREIIVDQTERDNVCIAPHDIDGDGKIDFALGAGWTKAGNVQWLSRGASLDDKWSVHFIAKEGWIHRVRWGDILGTGKPQLVVSPLNKTVAPGGVRLTAFQIPDDPRKDAWRATVLDESLNSMHNHWMGDLDGDEKIDLITASREGVFLFRRDSGNRLIRELIGVGAADPVNAPGNGAGEIKVGRFDNRPFLVTVEPMHGNGVAVYTAPAEDTRPWNRFQIDSTLGRGHALGTADLDQDGSDEIIVGHSDKGTGTPAGPGVFIYRRTNREEQVWEKIIVDDGGVATEDLIVEDFNADGRPDIVAVGRATHNVKIYWNRPVTP